MRRFYLHWKADQNQLYRTLRYRIKKAEIQSKKRGSEFDNMITKSVKSDRWFTWVGESMLRRIRIQIQFY